MIGQFFIIGAKFKPIIVDGKTSTVSFKVYLISRLSVFYPTTFYPKTEKKQWAGVEPSSSSCGSSDNRMNFEGNLELLQGDKSRCCKNLGRPFC